MSTYFKICCSSSCEWKSPPCFYFREVYSSWLLERRSKIDFQMIQQLWYHSKSTAYIYNRKCIVDRYLRERIKGSEFNQIPPSPSTVHYIRIISSHPPSLPTLLRFGCESANSNFLIIFRYGINHRNVSCILFQAAKHTPPPIYFRKCRINDKSIL